MNQELQGQRAVVTAGAGGAGLTIATTLRDAGATVFVCDVDDNALAALPDDLTGAKVDVSDANAVRAWLEPITADGVHILVNNAGIAGPTANVEDIDPEDWRRCISVDLDSQFFAAKSSSPI